MTETSERPSSGDAVARRHAGASLVAAVFATAIALAHPPAAAQSRAPSFVRDAETEALLSDYARPLFKVAGVPAKDVRLVLVASRDFNAFIIDGGRIFMNIGVLMEAATPNEVIGVLAHETGHIAGAHQVRFREALSRARNMALIGAVLGGAAIVGTARSGGGAQAGQAGAAVLTGSASLAGATMLAYARTEELAADRAAINYLEKTGQSAEGMLITFRRFADQMVVSVRGRDPYAFSHPMPRERISQIEELASRSKFHTHKDPPELRARHDLVRAKLVAFMDSPSAVGGRYPAKDTSLAARYARAVVAYRRNSPADAIRLIDELIREHPNNPYFHELKGQTLLEWGKPREAILELRRAVDLAPGPSGAPIRVMLGHALVATEDKGLVDEAIRQLTIAADRDRLDPTPWRHLARAWGMKGDPSKADLMVATGLFVAGDVKEARKYAARARDNLKTGSSDWLRADDIVSYKPDD
ncbi:MAG: M48 family metalloprotease [Siculibacillus sp.]|nr:M48 family metalloprotease [Siculibacillus sp.]